MLRDARVLAEKLIASRDWDAAGQAYAREHHHYLNSALKVQDWLFDILFELRLTRTRGARERCRYSRVNPSECPQLQRARFALRRPCSPALLRRGLGFKRGCRNHFGRFFRNSITS
jgi:2-polyprenyl-6-methoxyphenol hydroxylase-like FAD-dependent oxidoreductase